MHDPIFQISFAGNSLILMFWEPPVLGGTEVSKTDSASVLTQFTALIQQWTLHMWRLHGATNKAEGKKRGVYQMCFIIAFLL